MSSRACGLAMVVFFLLGGCSDASVVCYSGDREALLQFKSELVDPYGILPSPPRQLDVGRRVGGGLSGTLVANWPLKTLELHDNGLSASVPWQLCEVTLMGLAVSGNNFSGKIPSCLAKLLSFVFRTYWKCWALGRSSFCLQS